MADLKDRRLHAMTDSVDEDAPSMLPPAVRNLRDSERAIQALDRNQRRHERRLAKVEDRMQAGNQWFDAIDGRLDKQEELGKTHNGMLTTLVDSDTERKIREETLAEVAAGQRSFWRWIAPLIITLLFGLVGALVWLTSKLPN